MNMQINLSNNYWNMENPYSYEHEYLVQECLLKACEIDV